jgi:hypothetical protein
MYQVMERFLDDLNSSLKIDHKGDIKYHRKTGQDTFETLASSLERNLDLYQRSIALPTTAFSDISGLPDPFERSSTPETDPSPISFTTEIISCPKCQSAGRREGTLCCWIKTTKTTWSMQVPKSAGKKRSYAAYKLKTPPPLPLLCSEHGLESCVETECLETSSHPSTPDRPSTRNRPSTPIRSSPSSYPSTPSRPSKTKSEQWTCFTCDKEGHLSYNCPEGTACYRCHQEGHLARACPDSSSKRGTCSGCGKRGHGDAPCQQSSPRSILQPDGPSLSLFFKGKYSCKICGEGGHWCSHNSSGKGPALHAVNKAIG